jgi:hypothetical protein
MLKTYLDSFTKSYHLNDWGANKRLIHNWLVYTNLIFIVPFVQAFKYDKYSAFGYLLIGCNSYFFHSAQCKRHGIHDKMLNRLYLLDVTTVALFTISSFNRAKGYMVKGSFFIQTVALLYFYLQANKCFCVHHSGKGYAIYHGLWHIVGGMMCISAENFYINRVIA